MDRRSPQYERTETMNVTWQDAATACIVLAALAYLTRRVVRLIRRKGMPRCCCTKCPPTSSNQPLVNIERNKG